MALHSRRAFILVVLSAAFFGPSREASASCAAIEVRGMSPIQSALLLADLVFVGEVQEAELRSDPPRLRVRFRVTESVKGEVTSVMTFETRNLGEDFDFKKGQSVLVYMVKVQGLLSTACSRTRVVAAGDKEVQELQVLSGKAKSSVR